MAACKPLTQHCDHNSATGNTVRTHALRWALAIMSLTGPQIGAGAELALPIIEDNNGRPVGVYLSSGQGKGWMNLVSPKGYIASTSIYPPIGISRLLDTAENFSLVGDMFGSANCQAPGYAIVSNGQTIPNNIPGSWVSSGYVIASRAAGTYVMARRGQSAVQREIRSFLGETGECIPATSPWTDFTILTEPNDPQVSGIENNLPVPLRFSALPISRALSIFGNSFEHGQTPP